jgi:hypothetical protein
MGWRREREEGEERVGGRERMERERSMTAWEEDLKVETLEEKYGSKEVHEGWRAK